METHSVQDINNLSSVKSEETKHHKSLAIISRPKCLSVFKNTGESIFHAHWSFEFNVHLSLSRSAHNHHEMKSAGWNTFEYSTVNNATWTRKSHLSLMAWCGRWLENQDEFLDDLIHHRKCVEPRFLGAQDSLLLICPSRLDAYEDRFQRTFSSLPHGEQDG